MPRVARRLKRTLARPASSDASCYNAANYGDRVLSKTKLYEQRDTEALEDFYTRHVGQMTREELHRKAAIAAELAWRDKLIEAAANLIEVADSEYFGNNISDALERNKAEFDDILNYTKKLAAL